MNETFTVLTATAAPLPLENVDTDLIWPLSANFSLRKGSQAQNAFATLRFDESGAERPDFVLNRKPWRKARILIAGRNFGCGSSREMAVWALHEWGLRCIIAPSFSDIFFNNATLNQLLLITLPEDAVRNLMKTAADPYSCTMTVDLNKKSISAQNLDILFEIDDYRRDCFLHGLDQVSFTRRSFSLVEEFGEQYGREYPWTLRYERLDQDASNTPLNPSESSGAHASNSLSS